MARQFLSKAVKCMELLKTPLEPTTVMGLIPKLVKIFSAFKNPSEVMFARYRIQIIRTSAVAQMTDQHAVTMIER